MNNKTWSDDYGTYNNLKDYWYNLKFPMGHPKEGEIQYPEEYYSFDEDQLSIDPNETLEDIENYSQEKITEEIIKCSNNFAYFAMKYVKIVHPINGLVRFIIYDYQKRVIGEYTSKRFNLISKFRQGGLTTLTTCWALWRCLFKLDEQIMVMSKSDREAIKAGENVVVALRNFPKWLSPDLGKSNAHEHHFVDTGCKLSFWGPSAARGQALTWFIIDEAAFVDDMDKAWRAMYPTISTGGSCVAISTVNGYGNWYEETYHRAREGRNKFNIIDIDYHEHPEYNSEKWMLEQRAQLGDKGWMQEIERQFLGSGETYIGYEIIKEVDRRTRDITPIRKLFPEHNNEAEVRNEIENENFEKGAFHVFKEAIEGREYVLGVDVAEGVGSEGDNSCCEVFDMDTREQVAEFYSNRVQPHVFSQIVAQIGAYYNNALCIVENKGPGIALLSRLQHDLFYENIYFENPAKADKPGIKTSAQNRPAILEALQSALINKSIIINSQRFAYELKTFEYNSKTKKAEARKNNHDDAIISTAMILYVMERQIRNIPVGGEVPKEALKAFSSDIYQQIKAELDKGRPEDWFDNDDEVDVFQNSRDEELLGIMFDIDRPNNGLLTEFGW